MPIAPTFRDRGCALAKAVLQVMEFGALTLTSARRKRQGVIRRQTASTETDRTTVSVVTVTKEMDFNASVRNI